MKTPERDSGYIGKCRAKRLLELFQNGSESAWKIILIFLETQVIPQTKKGVVFSPKAEGLN
jgi:hypothetical protein